jgi:hypothetical protein
MCTLLRRTAQVASRGTPLGLRFVMWVVIRHVMRANGLFSWRIGHENLRLTHFTW